MPIKRFDPPWDYLRRASTASLQSFELSRLNHAANLRHEIAALLDQWLDESSQAMLARWLIEYRQAPRDAHEVESEMESPVPEPLPEGAPPKLVSHSRAKSRAAGGA